MGRAINTEKHMHALEQRIKLVEDALEEMIQTRVHHVDLHDKMEKHEEKIRKEDTDEGSVKVEGISIEPDEEFLPPAGRRKKTTKATATT